jgi:hypothetical protein
MWTGEIVELIHETDPDRWIVWIQTPAGQMKKDCTTEEVWNTLDYGQEYTMTNPCEDFPGNF